MGNSAHPLGNALLKRWACKFHESDLLTPAQGWFLLLAVAVAVTAALLVAFAHINGGGTAAATIALAYLGLSPVLRALSHRAEEDWVGLTLFLVTTMCILAFHGARTSPWAWLVAVGVSAIVLGVWHTQYLLVFAFGLVPWGVVAMLRPSLVGTTRPRALLLGAAMLPTVGVLGALWPQRLRVKGGLPRDVHEHLQRGVLGERGRDLAVVPLITPPTPPAGSQAG